MLRNLASTVFCSALMSAFLASALGAESERRGVETQTYDFEAVLSVLVRGFAGSLRIEPHSGRSARVRVKALDDFVRNLGIDLVEGRLLLVGPDPPTGTAASVIQFDGDTLIANLSANGTVVVGGSMTASSGSVGGVTISGSNQPVEVSILVPKDASLTLERFVGSAKIGAFDGPVEVDLAAAEVDIARARDATLNLSGTGSVVAAEVEGTLTVDLRGSGSVLVESGDISRLDVSVSGAGGVKVLGRAQSANLRLSGAGGIEIATVTEKPTTAMTGAGSIAVGNW